MASTTAAKSASTAPAAGASPASNSAIDAAAGAASPASKSAIDAAASPRDVESLSTGAAGLPVLTPGVAPPSAETAAEEEKIRGGEHKPAPPLSLLSSQSPVRFDHVQRRRRTRDSDVPYTFSIDGPWGAPTQVRFLFVPSSVAWLPFPRLFTHLSLSLFPFFLSSIPLCSRSLFLLPPSLFSLPLSSPSLFLLPPSFFSLPLSSPSLSPLSFLSLVPSFFSSLPLFSPPSLFFPLPPSFSPPSLLSSQKNKRTFPATTSSSSSEPASAPRPWPASCALWPTSSRTPGAPTAPASTRSWSASASDSHACTSTGSSPMMGACSGFPKCSTGLRGRTLSGSLT